MYCELQNKTASLLREAGIIPVLVLDDVDNGLRLCEALTAGGLGAAEITYRTKAAPAVIKEAKRRFPSLLLGAGTVLNTEHLAEAFDLGASFAVAPGFNPAMVEAAAKAGYAFSPGVATPSEIEQAYALGVRLMKFFPAEALGGVAMLKSLIAPYRHLGVSFMPTGGVTRDNAPSYLALPEVAAVGGTWLGKADDVRSGAWEKIEADAAAAAAMLARARA